MQVTGWRYEMGNQGVTKSFPTTWLLRDDPSIEEDRSESNTLREVYVDIAVIPQQKKMAISETIFSWKRTSTIRIYSSLDSKHMYIYIIILLLVLSLLLLLLLLYIIIYFHYRYYYSNIYIFILTGFCFNPLLTDDYMGLQYPIITIRLMLITIDDWRLFLLNGWSSHPKLVDDHNSCWEIRSEPQVEEGLRRCSTCLPQGREPKLRGGRGGLTVTIDHGWKKGDHPRLISGWWIIINCDNDAPRKSFNCVWMLNIKKTYGRSSLKCL